VSHSIDAQLKWNGGIEHYATKEIFRLDVRVIASMRESIVDGSVEVGVRGGGGPPTGAFGLSHV
jgi:hypothetical protein